MKVRFENLYRKTTVAPIVHGKMKYHCNNCGESWAMYLEIGVEDNGKNGKPHQPCPFCIPCECGGFAVDISGYHPLPLNRNLLPGMKYFAYDQSKKENACGKMSIYMGKENKMNDNDIIEAFDILDKFEFFDGQRAGRELWFDKPADIQEKDIADFNRDIDFLKAFIDRQKAEIERLTGYNENLQTANTALSNEILDIRNATIKELEEKLKSHKRRMCGNDNGGLYWDQAVLVDDIDRALKAMTEGES